jgi:hypothetical protein
VLHARAHERARAAHTFAGDIDAVDFGDYIAALQLTSR